MGYSTVYYTMLQYFLYGLLHVSAGFTKAHPSGSWLWPPVAGRSCSRGHRGRREGGDEGSGRTHKKPWYVACLQFAVPKASLRVCLILSQGEPRCLDDRRNSLGKWSGHSISTQWPRLSRRQVCWPLSDLNAAPGCGWWRQDMKSWEFVEAWWCIRILWYFCPKTDCLKNKDIQRNAKSFCCQLRNQSKSETWCLMSHDVSKCQCFATRV